MHKSGTITAIEDGILTIEICQQEACGSCAAKRVCGVSKAKEKLIECHVPNEEDFAIGDKVTVSISTQTSLRAMLIAFILPLVLMFIIIGALLLAGLGEGYAAVAAIGILVVYYGGVFIFQDTIKHRIIFSVKKC